MFSASIVGLWAYTTNEQSSHLMENLSTRNRELACEPIAAHASAIPRFSDMQPYSSSLVMAAVTHLFTSTAITAFSRSEPGHPQELVLFLMLVFASFPLWAYISRRRSLLTISLGALAAALLLTKINVGAVAMATLALT